MNGTDTQAYLVESIRVGLEDLLADRKVHTTGDVLARLTRGARKSIDITAMYWNLKPNPARTDELGFTQQVLESQFGGNVGLALYKALRDAAGRGVKIRIVQSPGVDATD